MLALWENPIFVRSRQVEKRRGGFKRPVGALLLAALPLAVAPFALLTTAIPQHEVAKSMAEWVICSQILLGLRWIWSATAQIFSACAAEREQQTLESLRSSLLTAREMVLGRLASGLWPVLREIAFVSPPLWLAAVLSSSLGAMVCFYLHVLPLVVLGGLAGMLSPRQAQATAAAYLLMLASHPARLLLPTLPAWQQTTVDLGIFTLAVGIAFLRACSLQNKPESR